MRSTARAAFTLLAMLATSACDEAEKANASTDAVVTADPPPEATAAASATPKAAPSEAAPDAAPPASVAMPERPVPKPQTMVSASAPQEVQMKAIGYMVAMRAPRPDDPAADEAYATDLVTRLRPVVLALDKGADKAKFNRVELIAQGRQIDLLMSTGCDARTPFNALVQRLGTPLPTLLSHGVLVIRCNDKKRQCLQSTRDPDDVLCTTAPRHR